MPRKALDETTQDGLFLRPLTLEEYAALSPETIRFLGHRLGGVADYASYLEGIHTGKLKLTDAS